MDAFSVIRWSCLHPIIGGMHGQHHGRIENPIPGLAPLVLLIASPLLALAFIQYGNIPADIKDEQVSAIKYADGLDAALYKMEWGRFQPDGVQIIVDQQRRFADYSTQRHIIFTPTSNAPRSGRSRRRPNPPSMIFAIPIRMTTR